MGKQKISKKDLQNLELLNTYQTIKNSSSEPLLAIDYGEKFCGIAHNPIPNVASPLCVVPTPEFHKEIKKLIKEKSVNHLIWGLPISSDGTENHVCKKIREEAQKYSEHGIQNSFVNERLSTQNIPLTQKEDRKDHLSASCILEFYFQGSVIY